MQNLNTAFYFVADIIISLQGFFIGQALAIGRVVLLIAILSAALNYALTGAGLKENAIKIMKATLFFLIVMFAYPKIISFITSWTFDMAMKSVYPPVEEYYKNRRQRIADKTNELISYKGMMLTSSEHDTLSNLPKTSRNAYLEKLTKSRDENGLPIISDPLEYFSDLLHTEEHPNMTYTTVAPAAVIKMILLIANDCINYADEAVVNLSQVLKGHVCAFFIILTGVFALLEYLMAFLEFMLVSTVGVILFPLSIWEGSKFMAEKFIGAILGFFVKLLFCNIAIFLMLYGFITLAYQFASSQFTGRPDQIVSVIFICLLFFYICKSAPGIAQSLLTGTPSLSAAGAISAVGGAVAAAGATLGMASSAGRALAGGAAKGAFGAVGAIAQANAASAGAAYVGGSRGDQFKAFMGSIGGSAADSVKAGAYGLTRSLLGAGNSGENPHSWRDYFNKHTDNEGESLSFGGYFDNRSIEGVKQGKALVRNST